jgi:hypothetical protein
MTIRALSILFVCLCTVVAFGYWRLKEAEHAPPVAQVAIIRDLSDSTFNDCAPVVNLTKRALALEGVGGGSTITFLTTGDKTTANEPQKREQLFVPDIRLVIEGKRRAEQQRNEVIGTMKKRCEDAEVTKDSPIFQAVLRGVEHLEGLGQANASRYLFVQTDGEELVNAQIVKALNQPPGFKLKLPTPINNEGVRVIFCGAAETRVDMSAGGRKQLPPSEQRAARRQEVWTGLFTQPSLVSFEPFCAEVGGEGRVASSGR